jgi:hypothetical protein
VPEPPCNMDFVQRPVNELALGAQSMRTALGLAKKEREALATSLRNAAAYYREVDEHAAEAIRNETPVPQAVVPGPADEDFGPAVLGAPALGVAAPTPEYKSVEQHALELEQRDQGVSLTQFATAWNQYYDELLKARAWYKPFEEWKGEAREQIEQYFDKTTLWLTRMGELSLQMAKDARGVVAAHKTVRDEHVRTTHYNDRLGYKALVAAEKESGKSWYGEFYRSALENSKRDLDKYHDTLDSLKIKAVGPDKPPTHTSIPAPPYIPVPRPDWTPFVPAPRPDVMPFPDPAPRPVDPFPDPAKAPDPHKIPWEKPAGRPDTADGDDQRPPPTPGGNGFNGLPNAPTMPSMPSMPSTPPKADPDAAEKAVKGLTGAPHRPPGGGVNPASFSGAAAPLQPWADDESMSRPAGAGSRPASQGRGAAGAAGAMGGGVGGAPVQGADKGAGKGKRVEGEDESLYTEDGAWTEGVVGLRNAKDVPEQ